MIPDHSAQRTGMLNYVGPSGSSLPVAIITVPRDVRSIFKGNVKVRPPAHRPVRDHETNDHTYFMIIISALLVPLGGELKVRTKNGHHDVRDGQTEPEHIQQTEGRNQRCDGGMQ